MTAFIVRRLLQSILVTVLLSFVIYGLMALMPGDPVDIMASSNPRITSSDIARLKKLYGVDQPIQVRYFNWLHSVFRGDLGYSRTYRVPCLEIITPRLINSFYLSFSAFILALIGGLILGALAALKPRSIFDYIANFTAVTGISIPPFWLGIVLILIFSVSLNIFPAGGTLTIGGPTTGLAAWTDRMNYLVLPMITLTALQLGTFVRFSRSAMLDVMRSDYIRTARAKGLSETRVVIVHGLRNALIPLITIAALSGATLLSGALITETVFAYQGIGKLTYDSIIANDFNVAMVCLMITVVMVLVMNIVADVLYAVADPRVTYK